MEIGHLVDERQGSSCPVLALGTQGERQRGRQPGEVFGVANLAEATRYETNTPTKSFDDPPNASIKLTKCW